MIELQLGPYLGQKERTELSHEKRDLIRVFSVHSMGS